MSKTKKCLTVAMMMVLSTSAVSAQEVGVKYSNDALGREFVNDLSKQLSVIKQQINALELAIQERKTAINYINKSGEYQYFTVVKGAFKKQLAHFADRIGVRTIRWIGVPECADWQLDSTYKIDMTNTVDAIDEFLNGMPLTYMYTPKDNSLNLTSTVIIQGCPDEQ